MTKPKERQRITLMLDTESIKSLRRIQATLIQKTGKSVSFSDVINDVVEKGLR